MTIRQQLQDLDALLGKSPAGHRVAFHRWWTILNSKWENDPQQPVDPRWERPQFLALATDALNRNDHAHFVKVCLRALHWEQLRMKEEQ